MIKKIRSMFESYLVSLFNRIDKPALENRVLLGRILAHQLKSISLVNQLADVEFKVFSQNGEDGIIQYLISKVPIQNRSFIEFGVSDYRESNTRFLLIKDSWKGLIIDSQKIFIDRIRSSDLYWQRDLTAIPEFIKKDNINHLFTQHGFTGDIGILSIDIDGNDYWIWEAITVIQPRIVICEYNSTFGKNRAVTILYDENFERIKGHYSNLYYGASLKALCLLAEQKGYVFAGSDSCGLNAFFVRKDVSKNITPLTAEQGYIQTTIRQSRDKHGNLTFISGDDSLRNMANKKVVDVTTREEILVKDLIS